MMRTIRALLGCSRREAAALAELQQHRADQEVARQAIGMKVDALKTGANRLTKDCRKTQEAAAELVARLREDLE